MWKAQFTIVFACVLLLACGDDPSSEEKFAIRGAVMELDQGIPGISILMDNQQAITTAADGSFAIEGLSPGTYLIEPEQAGRTFSPVAVSVTLTNENSEGNNFYRAIYTAWTHLNPNVYTVVEHTSSKVQFALAQNALWYQSSQGGLMYQSISGDFTITATVNAVKTSDNTQAVACNVCLGGLMARNPSDVSGQNYVHLVTGFTPNGLGYEVKNTTNNVSPYEAFGDGSAKHDLRIRRTGNSFTLYQKLTTATTWNVAATFSRPDLPAILQVGLNIYTAQAGAVADLSVIYENVVIE